MAFHWCEYFGGYTSSYCTTWTPSDWNSSTDKPLSDFVIGDSPVAQVTSSMLPITWQITSNLKLVLDDNNGNMRYTFYDASNNKIYQDEDWIGSDFYRYVIGFCVDDVRREGIIRFGQYRRGTTTVTTVPRPSTEALAQRLYSYFSEAEQPPVLYNWQSVPSISGKNGILSLAQIKEEYINDGESVSGASADHFTNLSTENRVDVLIDAALPEPEIGGTTVTVKYTIPSLSTGSYEYCKLVAKKNSMPESAEDGDKIVNIDPASTSASIKYLRGSTKYYFEIFVKTADGYEAVSNVKSITTGEAHDIVLFTNEFNEDILVDDWDIATYRSGWANGSTMWSPEQFSSDFLSKYNLFVGNSRRRPVVLGNGELTANCETSMTDSSFWIPIQRSIVPEEFKIEFDGNVSPQGSAQSYYNYIYVAVGCVDSNNGWHQTQYAGGIINDGNWVHYEVEITNWTYGYIDYIALNDCDGQPHWKNVKVTVG